MSPPRPGLLDYALLVGLGAVWGSTFLFIKLGMVSMPPATFTLLRLVTASAFMLAVAWPGREKLPSGVRVWTLIFFAALTGNALPFTLISWGEQKIDASLVAILLGGMPLFTVLMAHFFTDNEKLTFGKVVGLSFGVAGLVVLIGPQKLAALGDDTIRQLAVVGAALCYSVNAIIVKSLLGLPRKRLIAVIMVVSALQLLPVALYFEQPWTLEPTDVALGSAILLGVVHTAIATLVLFIIVARQGAGFFGQTNLLVPVFGVIWGVLFLAERPQVNHLIALGLILAGIVVARGRTRAPVMRTS